MDQGFARLFLGRKPSFGVGWLPIPWLYPPEIAALATASYLDFRRYDRSYHPCDDRKRRLESYIAFLVLNLAFGVVV